MACCDRSRRLPVFVHHGPHWILAIWLDVKGRCDEKSFDVASRRANQSIEALFVLVDAHSNFGSRGVVEVTPNIVDADHDAEPFRLDSGDVGLPSRLQVSHGVATGAGVIDSN